MLKLYAQRIQICLVPMLIKNLMMCGEVYCRTTFTTATWYDKKKRTTGIILPSTYARKLKTRMVIWGAKVQ